MTTYYLDPVAGSDAADGLSFANRKKTLQSLTSITAGDTVRVKQSPDPTSLGQNATWTDGSNTITLTTAVTTLISSCDSVWTGVTNVTASTTTTRKEGSNAANFVIASAFTTGKAAYFATGTLDLSSKQQVTFWIRQSTGTPAVSGDYELRLCTDTAGATGVHTLPIPAVGMTGVWYPVTVDLGSNMNSAIASVALYVNVDRGSATFQLDHISACKASSSADSLTLSSLIGKNNGTDPWLCIRSISGTTVIIDQGVSYSLSDAGTEPLYSGVTETVTAYKRETLKTPVTAAYNTLVNNLASTTAQGTANSQIVISGGWDSTAMTTQSGNTYLDGSTGQGMGMAFNSSGVVYSYITFSKLNMVRYYQGYYFYGTAGSDNNTISCSDINCNDSKGIELSTFGKYWTVNVTNICKNSRLVNPTGGTGIHNTISSSYPYKTITVTNLNSNWGNGYGTGVSEAGVTMNVTNACRNALSGVNISSTSSNINITNLNYNIGNNNIGQLSLSTANGLLGVSSHDNVITLGSSAAVGSSTNGIWLDMGANNNKIIVTGTFSGYTSAFNTSCIYGTQTGKNFLLSNGAPLTGNTQAIALSGTGSLMVKTADLTPTAITLPQLGGDAFVVVQNWNGVPGNHKFFGQGTNSGSTRFGL